ncbi:type III toxin-antitoxin system TenpIN family toxin [Collinsella aerofaciens]|uniref:type III toxin-antitoxin system TenpIN family toxin n=1 Tax=Collinsella aerofaciens TaxID=74426 RepID=UPI003F64D141
MPSISLGWRHFLIWKVYMNSRIVFLSDSFYRDHPNPPFKEMEQKQNRPYIVFLVEIEGHIWAIPFRSHIRHAYAFFTDPDNRCGIDYSKAVVVDRPEYINQQTRPHLRQNEFEALRGNEFAVQKGFEKYIKLYKKAVRSGHSRYQSLIKYSTLQNYEL